MGGQNPPRIDAGCGRVPAGLGCCGHSRCRNREPHEPGRRNVPGEAVDEPVAHEPGEQAQHQHRLEGIGSRPQQEMHEGQRRNSIDPAMQPVPARAAEPAYGTVAR
jgi:hypothetical protein